MAWPGTAEKASAGWSRRWYSGSVLGGDPLPQGSNMTRRELPLEPRLQPPTSSPQRRLRPFDHAPNFIRVALHSHLEQPGIVSTLLYFPPTHRHGEKPHQSRTRQRVASSHHWLRYLDDTGYLSIGIERSLHNNP